VRRARRAQRSPHIELLLEEDVFYELASIVMMIKIMMKIMILIIMRR
jgi:hypothetical protein